jgi:hypothetical protein
VSARWDWRIAIRDNAKLSWRAKLVGATLATHMNGEGGSCFPTIERLMAECGASESTVHRGIRELEKAKRLKVKRGGGRRKGGGYEQNEYTAI